MVQDDSIAKAKKAIAKAEKVRKSLVQQQSETGPSDPAALAEMQVKNLDKFAKKLKKQYKDAIDQNTDAKKEIAFIDNKLDYLLGKQKVVIENLTMRKEEYERLATKLDECVRVQNNLLHDVKGRVSKNHHILSLNAKSVARDTLQQSRGFSNQPGTTCTVEEGRRRTAQLKKITEERNKLAASMRSTGTMGNGMKDLQKMMNSMKTGGGLNASESMSALKSGTAGSGKGMKGSASTSAF